MEQRNDGGFHYTYSASEQAELKRIREKYESREENKLERVRRLDRRVLQRAQTVALILGVLGSLILGFGMSLVMTELAAELGIAASLGLPLGIGFGAVGGVLAGFAYPAYLWVAARERRRIAPEILRLTDELMK